MGVHFTLSACSAELLVTSPTMCTILHHFKLSVHLEQKKFALPGNGFHLEAFSSTEWMACYQRGVVEKRSTIYMYLTMGINGLYEHRGLICHSVQTSKRLDSGGEIARRSSTRGGHSVGSVSPQEEIQRSSEKNNVATLVDRIGHVPGVDIACECPGYTCTCTCIVNTSRKAHNAANAIFHK